MNVLSIDFDIIMHPDINLYNAYVGVDHPFEEIQGIHPLIQFCRADLTRYQGLLPFILTITQHLQIDDIKVAYNHGEIESLLQGCEDVHVYNVDHHHDLGYIGNNPEICSCANWADYYLKRGIISHYTWVRNSNSDIGYDYEDNDERITVLEYQDYNLYNLPKIDKLFLCLSPEWVPEIYHPLFFTTLDLINQQKNCHLEVY